MKTRNLSIIVLFCVVLLVCATSIIFALQVNDSAAYAASIEKPGADTQGSRSPNATVGITTQQIIVFVVVGVIILAAIVISVLMLYGKKKKKTIKGEGKAYSLRLTEPEDTTGEKENVKTEYKEGDK